MRNHVLLINGSYRQNGYTDRMLQIMGEQLNSEGVTHETIILRDYPIEFCTNCRTCTRHEGNAPGQCIHHDGMEVLIEKIESADGYVFASPTNFGTVTAVFKRFLERLVVYGYWPWEQPYPKFRKTESKAAICLSSCAAPSLIGRFMFGTLGVMKQAARCVGAKVVDTLLVGQIADQQHKPVDEADRKRIQNVTRRLIDAL
jgi:NAD(P)H-dependent FMN reductase